MQKELHNKFNTYLIDVATQMEVAAEIYLIKVQDLNKYNERSNWHFNWFVHYSDTRGKIYGIKIPDSNIPEGLISIELKQDHLFLGLIEVHPHNFGSKNKKYDRVLEALTAFGCLISAENGFNYEVVFEPKTKLFQHYQNKLRGVAFGNRMLIYSLEAKKLIALQYKNYFE